MIDKRSPRFWFSIYGFTAIIMCIAVSVFFWLASESRKAAGEGRTASARPPANQRIPEERLELLAQFEPPGPDAAAAADPALRLALGYYDQSDYSKAVPELRALSKSQPDLAAAHFYLGVCLLLTDQRVAGLEQLRMVLTGTSSPYQEPARFYLAKGLLGAGDPVGASRQLEEAIAMHGQLEKQAQALLAQIR